jgi:hypothetical protein
MDGLDKIVNNSLNWLDKNPDFLKKHEKEIEMFGKDEQFTSSVINTLKKYPKVLVAVVQLMEQDAKPSVKLLRSGGCK